MDDELEKKKPSVQADDHSIAIGEIHIGGNVTGNITIGSLAEPATDARLRHELGILLKNVQTTWIKGVLEKSVHEAALLELGLELREEAVDNPWRMVMEAPDQTRETLPRGRRIKDIFDEANRLLLILGEPGSGKTTTLLQLARDLIADVDDAFTQPVPVILNLSTWTNKQQPLDEWLIAELNSKYRLPKKDGQRWLKERRILPLLDGLDEVRAENRAACVEKINQLITDYGLQGMVVCSRIKDYAALNVRLAFYRAIYIQPLTMEQVDEYLNQAGDKLASLRTTLQADEALRSMAQSPLILNIMSLAYQNASAEALSDPSLNTNKARRQHLFDTYITRMFNRKVGTREYDTKQTKQWLSWLAQNMQKHNQEVFLIEGLQPTWLSERSWHYFFVSRLISGLIVGLSVGWFLGTNSWQNANIAIIIGFSAGLIDALEFEWLHNRNDRRKSPRYWWLIPNIIIVGVISFLLFAGLISDWFNGLVYGVIFWIKGSRQDLEKDIQAFQTLHWSSSKALRGWLNGLICGAVVGMVSELIGWLINPVLFNWTSLGGAGMFFGLLGGVIGVMLSGLRQGIIETKTTPNQGMWFSIRNAIYGGLLFGLLVGLLFSLVLGPLFGMFDGLLDGILLGLSIGPSWAIIGFLLYGGFDVIEHYTLRLILIIRGDTPRNYARFLDYAVDRIFLQKVGGGYRFIHRLLLEHFAETGEVKRG